jgi:hypothetical protein
MEPVGDSGGGSPGNGPLPVSEGGRGDVQLESGEIIAR